eukprot:37713_1
MNEAKQTITNRMIEMGFDANYSKRSVYVYTKHYGIDYDMNVLMEIMFRLHVKDQLKEARKTRSIYPLRSQIIAIVKTMHFSSRYIYSALASYENTGYFRQNKQYNLPIIIQSILKLRAKHRENLISNGNAAHLKQYNDKIKQALIITRTCKTDAQFPSFDKLLLFAQKGGCDDLQKCHPFKRIQYGLHKYQMWLKQIEMNAMIMVDEHYSETHVLDDYHHLMYCHNIEDIHHKLNIKCDVDSCKCLMRNYRNRHLPNNHKMYFGTEIEDINCEQIMDCIHCYFVHSFDLCLSLTRAQRASVDSTQWTVTIHKIEKIISNEKRLCICRNTKFLTQLHVQAENTLIGHVGTQYNYYNETDAMYVQPYYASIKEEILSNKCIQMRKRYFDVLCLRAQQMKNKQYSKLYKAEYNQCGVQYQSCIQIKHILSLILYCNHETISQLLSKTYIACNKRTMIETHSKYAHLAQNITEMVQIFGDKTPDKGVFYHIMKGYDHEKRPWMPCFATKICISCPLSTTKSLHVLLSYHQRTHSGILMELEDANPYFDMKYFECQWISDFGGEDEVLFDGNKPLIHQFVYAKAIRMDNKSDLSIYAQAFGIINCIFSAQIYDRIENANRYITQRVVDLIRHQLKLEIAIAIPVYVQQWIECYFADVKVVRINWHHLLSHYSFVEPLLGVNGFIDLFTNATKIIIIGGESKSCPNKSIIDNIYLCLRNRKVNRLRNIEMKQMSDCNLLLQEYKQKFQSIHCSLLVNRKATSLMIKCLSAQYKLNRDDLL